MSLIYCRGVQVAVTLVAAALMDRAGRRVLLMLAAGGIAVSSAVLGGFFYMQQQGTVIGWLALTCLILYVSSFSIGMSTFSLFFFLYCLCFYYPFIFEIISFFFIS